MSDRRYVTTFPCHNRAKHIIAAGLGRVVYLEPYPKSRAKDLHGEEIDLESVDGEQLMEKSSFAPIAELRRASIGSIQIGFKAACRRAKIEDFNIHDLRRHCASRLVQYGVPLQRVQRLLGHKSMRMTERYVHLAPSDLNDAVAVLGR